MKNGLIKFELKHLLQRRFLLVSEIFGFFFF